MHFPKIIKDLENFGEKISGRFRAAFDPVNRDIPWKSMGKAGISMTLIKKMQEIYAETSNVVRINGEITEEFWSVKGLRQVSPLSPILFAIYIADVKEAFKKGQAGGVVIGKEKIWTLAYADDIMKATAIMKETWRIGERKLGAEFLRRMMLFDSLVTSVILYGAEIWGWKEYSSLEALQRKYIR